MEEIEIHTEHIQLDQFLKLAGALPSGGAVKGLLEQGEILRNGEIESARRRKLFDGDVIEVKGIGCWKVCRKDD